MHRRTIVVTAGGTLAGALTGCISSTDGNESPTPTHEPSTTPTPTSRKVTDEARQRTVSLENQDEVPKRHRVSVDVEVLEPAITAAHTGRIRVTTTNEGPARSLSVGPDMCSLFNRSRAGSDDPAGLWLQQSEESQDANRKGERWVLDRPQSQHRGFPAYGCLPRAYESEESVSTEYEVWDDYRIEGYLQPGTYRWEEEIQIWDDTDAKDTDSPSATFTWGFSISVEKAD